MKIPIIYLEEIKQDTIIVNVNGKAYFLTVIK